MEQIDGHMIVYRTMDMIAGVVHEIVEPKFQELKLAIRNETGGSISGYRNL